MAVEITMADHRQGKAEATKHVPKIPKVPKTTKRKGR